MSREIKFRGKSIYSGEWFYGSLNKLDFNDGQRDVCGSYITSLENRSEEVDNDTVGQFTGLKDKNGKEIYEGDIVKFGQYEYQIIYEIGGFGLLDVAGLMIGKIGGINDHVYSLQVLYLECCWEESSAFDLEVIGNIHDNPEFLESK
jgi:uncharacterized phage protein (TIGR01671 family)